MLTEYCITNNMSWDNNPKENTNASSYKNYGQHWSKEADKNDNYATTDCAIKIFLNGQAGGSYNGTKGTETNYSKDANTTGTVYATANYTEENPEYCAYNDCFNEKERSIIMSTYNGEITEDYNNCTKNLSADNIKWYISGGEDYYACGCRLNGDKIFLLSGKEVTEEKYGFEGSREYKYSNNTRLANDPIGGFALPILVTTTLWPMCLLRGILMVPVVSVPMLLSASL